MKAPATQAELHSAAMSGFFADVRLAHAHDDATASLFGDNEHRLTKDIAAVFADMEAAGYVIGTPKRSLHCVNPHHSIWHVAITTPEGNTATLAFDIPGEAS